MAEIELIEAWLRYYNDSQAQIYWDNGKFVAETVLPYGHYTEADNMIEAVKAWGEKYGDETWRQIAK